MPAKKKTKKPAANPARGFATTSVASKPRADLSEPDDKGADDASAVAVVVAPPSTDALPAVVVAAAAAAAANTSAPAEKLSPEEYEKHLEEAELQLLVEKYAHKVKRDAQRQAARLETDRRLLRGQAEPLNTKKWLPQELMDHVLDLIQAEGRFAASSVKSDGATSKLLPEEDLTIRLWTLQKTLEAVGFATDKILRVLQYILDITPNLSPSNKWDSIWGLEEALDWFARESSKDELPDYQGRDKKSQPGKDTSLDASRAMPY